jgi:L-aspartate oxidase
LVQETDFIVVGAGIAGMRAAIELSAYGRVLCLAKLELTESNTQYAQGGIAVALSDEDEICLHLQDTLLAGDGLCNADAARILVEEGPVRIEELIKWGTQFDKQGTRLSFSREGAHSRDRVLHANGDSTGREIGRALYHRAASLKHISFREFGFATNLWMEDGGVVGIHLLNENGEHEQIGAAAVMLATGGMGQVFANTTNPGVATGDGVAMAFRAGAEISDMEFIQFHPTALYLKNAPRFLLSEALRGEGAYLRNDNLRRFMPKYHNMAELAPRDIVARAIAHELEISSSREPVVYLDLTHLNGERLKKRFPRIYGTCLKYNIDLATDMVPIRPAAHYSMGGVRTDLYGHTSLPGLFAAGEAACTGVHGANRLASNSLLEGLVYGARAAGWMGGEARLAKHGKNAQTGKNRKVANGGQVLSNPALESQISALRELMWRNVGIVREGKQLRGATAALSKLQVQLPEARCRREWEAQNLAVVAQLIARSALAREESRGAQYRLDYPAHNDARFLKHSVIAGDKLRFE